MPNRELRLFKKSIDLSFDLHYWYTALGLITLSITWQKQREGEYIRYPFLRSFSFHLFPRKDSVKRWGHDAIWFNGYLHTFGIGPFLMIAWTWEY